MPPGLFKPPQQSLSRLAAILWFGSVGALTIGWAATAPSIVIAGTVVSISFILCLIALIWRSVPVPGERLSAQAIPGFSVMLALIVAGIALTFAAGLLVPPWLAVTAVLGFLAIPIIVSNRRHATPRLVAVALAASGICLALSLANGESLGAYLPYMLAVTLSTIGGALLVRRTRLSRVYAVDGSLEESLRSFAIGLVLALPSSLMDLTSGVQAQDSIRAPWQTLTAFVPGFVEESVARLMLLSLCYALLIGRRGWNGKKALAAAVLISAFTHALSHLPASDFVSPAGGMMLFAGALFGVPMGLVFLRFGFEAAVAYHFLIDLVRFIAAYLIQ